MQGSPKLSKAVEFRSASLSTVTTVLRDVDPARVEEAMQAILGGVPDFFDGEPTVIDFGQIDAAPQAVEWAALLRLLRAHRLQPVAVRHLDAPLVESARQAGLAILDDEEAPVRRRPETAGAPEPPQEESRANAGSCAPAPQPVAAVVPVRTLIVERTLRSGQQVYARGGDLIVLGSVSNGAEVIADGNVHCYGPLRGRAVAGARGDVRARIFTTALHAELISIAGTYRTFENGLPENVEGRPAHASLSGDGTGAPQQLLIVPLGIG